MSNFFVLFSHIFFEKLKSKGYLISTIFLLIAITGVIFVPKVMDALDSEGDSLKVLVLDQTDEHVSEILESTKEIVYTSTTDSLSEIDEKIASDKYDGALVFSKNANGLTAELRVEKSLSTSDMLGIEQTLENVNFLYTVQQSGITPEQAEHLFTSQIDIKETALNESGASKSSSDRQLGIYLSYFVGFLIYIFILSYLSMITTDISNEKGSRIMELLISSVTPRTHLLAKISGILAVGVLQLVILISYSLGLLYLVGGEKWELFKDVANIVTPQYFVFTFLYIVLAYILYLTLGALLGSFTSKVEEASQALLPALMLVMLGFAVMFYGVLDPNALIVEIFSYIPFTSSMVMPLRIGSTFIATWEIVLSLAILLITVVLLFGLSSRLYKGSVLVYNSNSIFKRYKNAWELGNDK
ncbi:ABC transporter permease [Mesobacillus maritimus]|uniref:ABC transporter permease n=1 Tax=Mesobacillus maritimus TaxID=1643336 RepID=UPI00203FACCE|nr:ABC transporter permease [Mesobacillus maritimus]MCM3670969.1 ABC transporter permease [Mesobacillus maritimus]